MTATFPRAERDPAVTGLLGSGDAGTTPLWNGSRLAPAADGWLDARRLGHMKGAAGGPSWDDTDGFLEAMDVAKTAGAGLLIPRDRFRMTPGLAVLDESFSDVPILADGAVLDCTAATVAGAAIQFKASASGTPVSMSADALKDTNVIHVDTTGMGLEVGDMIRAYSDLQIGFTGYKAGGLHKVWAFDATSITIYGRLDEDYLVADGAKVRREPFGTGGGIHGVQYLGPDDITLSTQAVMFERWASFKASVRSDHAHHIGLGLTDCIDVDAIWRGKDGLKSGLGYGLAILNACRDIRYSVAGERVRHPVTHGASTAIPGFPRDTYGYAYGRALMDALWDVHPGGENCNLLFGLLDYAEDETQAANNADGITFQGGSGSAKVVIRTATRHGALIQPLSTKPLNFDLDIKVARCTGRAVLVQLKEGSYGSLTERIKVTADADVCLRGVEIDVPDTLRATGVQVDVRARNAQQNVATIERADDADVTVRGMTGTDAGGRGLYAVGCNRGSIKVLVLGRSTSDNSYLARGEDCHDVAFDVVGTNAQTGLGLDDVSTNCRAEGDTTGCTTPWSLGAGGGHVLSKAARPRRFTSSVAAASPLTLSYRADIFLISGSGNITAFDMTRFPTDHPRVVCLENASGSSWVLKHGGTIHLDSGDFDVTGYAARDARIWLYSPDGVQIREIRRSTPDSRYQPIDADLTAIAALATTTFGRSLLTQADAATALTTLGAQPADSDLTAIAALSTTTFGRSLLTATDAASLLASLGGQPLDADLTAIAALTTTSFGRGLLTTADAASLLTSIGAQPLDADLTAIAALSTTAFGRSLLELADAAAARSLIGVASSGDVAADLATYKVLRDRGGQLASGSSTGPRLMGIDVLTTASSAGAGRCVFYFDPAAYAVSGYTTKVRVMASILVNATGVGSNLTVELVPVTAAAGTTGTVSVTVGAAIASVTFTSPAAGALLEDVSADISAPSAGFYALQVKTGSTVATGSEVAVRGTLQMRQV